MIDRVRTELDARLAQFPHLTPCQALRALEEAWFASDESRWQEDGGSLPVFAQDGEGIRVEIAEAIIKSQDHDFSVVVVSSRKLFQPLLQAHDSVTLGPQQRHVFCEDLGTGGGAVVRRYGVFRALGNAVIHENRQLGTLRPRNHPMNRLDQA